VCYNFITTVTQNFYQLKEGISKMAKYEHLMQPITFRRMTVKNRVFLPPMKTNYIKKDHTMSDDIIQYYEDMAKGGIGLITTEAAEIDGEHLYDETILGIFDDSQIEGFKKLADALHKYDTKLSVQLIQGGPFANSGYNEGRMPLSCTPIAHVWNPFETPIEMTKEDVQHYVQKYSDAAIRAQKAGVDAVEIHCAHGHALLGSFLSALVNHRTDEYGGDIYGRSQFLVKVCEGIRNAVGEDFPISVRLSADDCELGGTTAQDNIFVIRRLEEIGIDYIHFSNGTLYDVGTLLPPTGTPRALNTSYTDIIRKAVKMPFGVVGRMKEPWVADLMIEQGKMDIAYIGRSLIADSEFVSKSESGHFEDIRPCIGCLHCLATSALGITMECTMNPGIADYHLKNVILADVKKKVLVIGGGPAGLEAATTAQKRGHEVILVEKADKLGGQLILASYPPVKQEISCGLKWMIHEVEKVSVDIRLNTECTVELVKEINPDEIILATGGKPIMPRWIAESNHPNIVFAWDILSGKAHAGMNNVVIGGGSVGCETAEFISPKHNYRDTFCKKITLIEMQPNIDMTDATANRDFLMARLATKPIDIQTSSKVTSITESSVSYEKDGQEYTISGVDTLIIAIGTQPVNDLEEELNKLGKPIHTIGDASCIGKIVNATSAGRKVAINI
jgi:2,4-dienoyl-CoA reductase-like NADH-dependent reductase (Old Yellow Enzyme family)/NADPH-dependent 2,4-dienoyl-CoA reductase/sulfur reductase-like enzyme